MRALIAASCLAVCSLNNLSSESLAVVPAVTFRSVDLDLGLLLSLEFDLRARLGDLELLLLSGLLGDLLLPAECREGGERRGEEGRLWGGDLLATEGRLGERALGEVRRTVLSVAAGGLTGLLLLRLGDLLLLLAGLLLLLGDLDFLLGDLDFLLGDLERLRLGLLGLSDFLEGLDLFELAAPFREVEGDLVRLLRSEGRALSSDFMFTDIVPEPDTTLLSRSLRSLSDLEEDLLLSSGEV